MKRLVAVMFAVLTLLASPAMAVEPVTTLPEVKPVESGRIDLAVTINKDVILFAKAEFAGDRLHAVAVDVEGRQVIEIVVIANRLYLRQNTNPRWQATTVEIDEPGDVEDVVGIDLSELEESIKLYNLGTVNVRGIATTQYQAQVDPVLLDAPNNVDYAFNLNAFIGNADSFLHKFQATILDASTGRAMLLETPLDIFDFNQTIVIGAPDPPLGAEVGSLAVMERADLPGANVLPFWMRPLEEYSLKAKGYIQ